MKKLTQLILFSCLLFLLSCQSIPKGYHTINGTYDTTGTEPCNNLMQKIKKEWAMSDTCKCYYYNEKLVKKILKNKNCFIGMDSLQIINLFGMYNRNDRNDFEYFFTNKGDDCDTYYSLRTIYFNFDLNNKVNNVEFKVAQWIE